MAADGSSAADFTLRLRNQVTGPARDMRRSIRGLNADLRAQQRFFDQGETEFQKKLKESRRVADAAHGQELRAMRERKTAAERAAAASKKLQDREAARAKRARDAITRRNDATRQRLAQRRDIGFQRQLIRQREAERSARSEAMRQEGLSPSDGMSARSAIVAATGAVVAFSAAIGFLAFKFTSATVAAVDFGQRSRTALASILKDGQLAAQQFNEVRGEAGKLGLDVVSTVDQFKMLANAGFKVPVARELVRMSADLQALTGSSESAHFALRAISQIKMKGRLQAEEITGQLAEHGVSADAVYAELGKTLGKTRDEILKMQKAGDLSADIAIPAILQAVRNQLGVEQSGGFAEKMNKSSLGGMFRTLKAQVQNAFISLGDRVAPGMTKAFQSIMASIQNVVAGPKAQALSTALVDFFNRVSEFTSKIDFAGLLADAATVLGTEIQAAAVFIRDNGAELRETFTLFVRSMGVGLKAAVDFMKPIVDFLNSPFGRFMFTPTNEVLTNDSIASVMNPDGSLKSRSQRAIDTIDSAAGKAGAAAGGRGGVGDVKFGDVIVNLTGSDANADSVGGDIAEQTRKHLLSALQDLR